MPRKRPQLDHADWHVTARGSRRLVLFHDESDFQTFYAFLGYSCHDSGVGLIADCLMSNHFHLGLSGSTRSLTRCMQKLNRSYSGYHNERYGLSGHAFEQTFYSDPIGSDFILKRVVRYIHMNPVRAGLSSRPEDYSWSSYKRLTEARSAALGDEEKRVLGLFDSDFVKSQALYTAFTEKDLHRRIAPPVGRSTAWEIWQEQFVWILEFMADHSEELKPLTPEHAAVYLGSRAGIPPRAMGRVLNHVNGRQVSEMIRAVNRRIETNPGLGARLTAIQLL